MGRAEGRERRPQAVQGGRRGGLAAESRVVGAGLGLRAAACGGPTCCSALPGHLGLLWAPELTGSLRGAPGRARRRSEEASGGRGGTPRHSGDGRLLSPSHSPWWDHGQPSNVTSGGGPGGELGCGPRAPTASAGGEGAHGGDCEPSRTVGCVLRRVCRRKTTTVPAPGNDHGRHAVCPASPSVRAPAHTHAHVHARVHTDMHTWPTHCGASPSAQMPTYTLGHTHVSDHVPPTPAACRHMHTCTHTRGHWKAKVWSVCCKLSHKHLSLLLFSWTKFPGCGFIFCAAPCQTDSVESVGTPRPPTECALPGVRGTCWWPHTRVHPRRPAHHAFPHPTGFSFGHGRLLHLNPPSPRPTRGLARARTAWRLVGGRSGRLAPSSRAARPRLRLPLAGTQRAGSPAPGVPACAQEGHPRLRGPSSGTTTSLRPPEESVRA